MASLKELKDRIGSVKSTQKITKAKQMVAAAKLRKAQAAAEAARPYAERLASVMAALASKVSGDDAPKLLAGTGSDKRHLLVVVNTDQGPVRRSQLEPRSCRAAKAKNCRPMARMLNSISLVKRAALRLSVVSPAKLTPISIQARALSRL